jgi:xanthine dehydrogenase YagT iron-sulfur-binding subunit
MSNSSRPTSNATPEANPPDTSAKTPKEKSADISVSVTVNGRVCTIMVEPRMTLLDAWREELALTGTKRGCDRGECGAMHRACRRAPCAALHDLGGDTGRQAHHYHRRLEREGQLHPLQAAFIEQDGFQCGICISGQIISAVAMIEEAKAGWPSAATAELARPFNVADLSRAEIRERMSGNLCRCACNPKYRRCHRRSGCEVLK